MHRKLASLGLGLVLSLGILGATAPAASATHITIYRACQSNADTAPFAAVFGDVITLTYTASLSWWTYANKVSASGFLWDNQYPSGNYPETNGPQGEPPTAWVPPPLTVTARVGNTSTFPKLLRCVSNLQNGTPSSGTPHRTYWDISQTYVSGPTHDSLLAFNGPCAANQVINHYTVNKVGSGNTKYNGVESVAPVRELYPCTLVAGNPSGVSLVLPANLQQQSSFGGANTVQLGYGKRSGDFFLDFYYTAADNQSGLLTAVTWFVGPTVGHFYGFSITAKKVGGNNYWRYCISDLTALTSGCTDRAATWTSGSMAWWGYETHDVNDALGVRYGDTSAAISALNYRTNNTWTHLLSPVCIARDAGLPYYHCDQAAGDAINGYTTAH